VEQFFITIFGCEFSFSISTKTGNINALAVYSDVILSFLGVKAVDLGFPELSGVMLVDCPLLFCHEIDYLHVISVDVNGLICNHQLLVLVLLVPCHHNVSVIDLQFVPDHEDELLLRGIILLESDYVEPKPLLIIIEKHIKDLVLMIIFNFFDCLCVKKVVQVYLLIGLMVVECTVKWARNY